MPASSKRRSRISVPAALLAAALLSAGSTAQAGSQADPEITDVAGDANFINGQRGTTCLLADRLPDACTEPGAIPGTNPVPESVDELDLRVVWFETEYESRQVRDPATGEIARVEHDPTALAIHIKTEGPATPVPSQWTSLNYRVPAALPQCNAFFELRVSAAGTTAVSLSAGSPFGGVKPDCDLEKDPGEPDYREVFTSPVPATFDGAIATFKYPLAECASCGAAPIWRFIPAGTSISRPYAFSRGNLQVAGGALIADETAVGRAFTIGQDVPPDVDCGSDPGNAECQP